MLPCALHTYHIFIENTSRGVKIAVIRIEFFDISFQAHVTMRPFDSPRVGACFHAPTGGHRSLGPTIHLLKILRIKKQNSR